jgi:hypothetical protein
MSTHFHTLRVFMSASMLLFSIAALATPETDSRIDRAPLAVNDPERTPEARVLTNQFSRCFAAERLKWAREVVALPYAEGEQSKRVHAIMGGMDECLGPSRFDLRLVVPSIIGAMAEQLILKDFKSVDVSGLAKVDDDRLFASQAAPRNLSEDFGMCVARRDPVAVRQLIDAGVATTREAGLLGKLRPHLGPCVPQGLSLRLNPATIRSLSVVGLYRLLSTGASTLVSTSRR